MFEIRVSATFTARHQVRQRDGSLEPVHGHAWNVRVTYTGPELNEAGFLVDFTAVRRRLASALRQLDGKHLNRTPAFRRRPPSAENVARFLAEQLLRSRLPRAHLACVEVEEESGCFARYRPPAHRPRPTGNSPCRRKP